MKAIGRSAVLAGAVALGSLLTGASEARAQFFGFGYASPGLSFGMATGAPGFYGGGFYGGYPVVAPPVVVAPVPVVVPRPYYYGYGPRPYYGGYHAAYRPYPHYYRR